MESPDSPPNISRETLRRFLSELDDPSAPFTTAEVADQMECTDRTAERNLTTLVDLDELRTREMADGSRIWWQPAAQETVSDRKSSLQEFGAFVSAVKDYAIFMLNPDGVIISWNQGAERTKGYAEDEIIGEHFSTFYTDEDAANGVPKINLETATEEGRVEDEGWRVRKDGSQFWANVIITAIRDVDGTLQGFTKVTRDMTEQREYELQLRNERDLVEQVLETVPVGIGVIDSDGVFDRTNQQALKLLEIEESDIRGFAVDAKALYDAKDALIPEAKRPWTRVIDTGQPVYDFQCRTGPEGGDRRWLSINAVPLESGLSDEPRTVVSIEDITEQKEREWELEQRKMELETELGEIMGRISDAFFALDEEWRFTHLNRQTEELFEQPADEISGRSFWEVFPERSDGQLRKKFDEAMASQEPVNFELYDGEHSAWLEFNAYPSETGLSIYVHDITDRREYQQRLEESNERLEQFAHAASHDMQEPLRMVSSYLQLIERRYGEKLDGDGREFLEFAVDGADRMRNMINSLLAYSRVQTHGASFESVNLDAVFAEVRDDLQRKIAESNAELAADSLPRVEGDANQLRQVFLNLVDNAIEYSNDGPPRVQVDAERSGDMWTVSISDEGIGIDPDNVDRIFEVFHRLHTNDEHEGTGIGLALCERIIERHGGEIWAESEPGEGSTFSFTLPAGDG